MFLFFFFFPVAFQLKEKAVTLAKTCFERACSVTGSHVGLPQMGTLGRKRLREVLLSQLRQRDIWPHWEGRDLLTSSLAECQVLPELAEAQLVSDPPFSSLLMTANSLDLNT